VLIAVAGLLAPVSEASGAPVLDTEEQFARAGTAEQRKALLRSFAEARDAGAAELIVSLLAAPDANAELLPEAIIAARDISSIYLTDALIGLSKARIPTNLLIQTIDALGRKGASDAVPALAPHLRSSDDRVRDAASTALIRCGGHPAINAVLPLLKDPSPAVRRSAVKTLGGFKHPRVMDPLLKAWANEETRFEATSALANFQDVRALDAYLAGLGERNAVLRSKCARAIDGIKAGALSRIEAMSTNLQPLALLELRKIYETNAAARNGAIFSLPATLLQPEDYQAFAAGNPGDAARGRAIFTAAHGLGCIACHKVGGEGSDLGPDLSKVGSTLSRAKIADKILHPSRNVRDDFRSSTIVLRGGELREGLVRLETPELIGIIDEEGREHLVRKTNIKERRPGERSLMPQGLQAGLTMQEFADLVAFVENLQSRVVPSAH